MITHYALNPFSEMKNFQREMNRLFRNYERCSESYPAINLMANEEKAVVTSEIPGVEEKDLNITVNKNELTIEGEKKSLKVSDQLSFQRKERGGGSFSRTVKLPFDVDNEKVEAKYQNGVLTLILPRTESSKPKKIAIVSE